VGQKTKFCHLTSQHMIQAAIVNQVTSNLALVKNKYKTVIIENY
jgi:hypothetical protein